MLSPFAGIGRQKRKREEGEMMRGREREKKKNEKKKHILEILARKKSHEGKRGP